MLAHLRNPRTDRYALLLLLIMLTIVSISASDAGTWGRVVTMVLISATVLLALRTSNARPLTIRVALGLVAIGIVSSLVAGDWRWRDTVDWVTNVMAVMLAAVGAVRDRPRALAASQGDAGDGDGRALHLPAAGDDVRAGVR